MRHLFLAALIVTACTPCPDGQSYGACQEDDPMKNLTPVASFDVVAVPEDGVDKRTAASMEIPIQKLANRDAAIMALITGDGINRIAAVESLSALKALEPTDGDVVRLGAAIYVFIEGSTLTPNDIHVIKDDGETGRWVHGLLTADGTLEVQAAAGDAVITGWSVGSGARAGLKGIGTGAGAGVTGYSTSGPGLYGESSGSGAGAYGRSSTSQPGVRGYNDGTGPGGSFQATDRGAINLVPRNGLPAGAKGDLYVDTAGTLHFHNGTEWKEVALVP